MGDNSSANYTEATQRVGTPRTPSVTAARPTRWRAAKVIVRLLHELLERKGKFAIADDGHELGEWVADCCNVLRGPQAAVPAGVQS